jgi:L-tyrosine isonitrile synthase
MNKFELCAELLCVFETIRKKHETDGYTLGGRDLLLKKFEMTIAAGQPLLFVLPAFPCKSQNRDNTLGKFPDRGEEVALSALHGMCEKMREIYPPGAEMVLASDGRLYADLIGVPDTDVLAYRNELLVMYRRISGRQEFLNWYSLDEAFPIEVDGGAKREALMERYPQTAGSLMELVYRDPDYNRLYVGFKNMMISELLIDGARSRKSIEKEASRIARKMLERNFANAALIKEKFAEHVRLSIKHHDTRKGIFGVNLLPGHDDVGTPWLNVLVEFAGGKLDYVKRCRAEAQERFKLVLKDERPYFYREC